MPFIKIDFASYDSSELVKKQVTTKWKRLLLPIQICCSLLLIRFDFGKQKANSAKYIFGFQLIFITALTLWISAGLVVSIVSKIPLLPIIFLIGITDFFLLLWWNFSNGNKNFADRLSYTTGAMGLLKGGEFIQKVNNWSFFFHLATGILTLLLFVLAVFEVSPVFSLSTSLSNLSRLLLCSSLLVLSLANGGANTLFYTVTTVIAAEFALHDADFIGDGNNYQIAVVKHYVHIHWKLSELFVHLKRPFSYWLVFRSIFSIFAIASSIDTLRSIDFRLDEETLLHLSTISLYCLYSIISTISLLLFSLYVRRSIVTLRNSLMKLMASEKGLHDQTYSLAIAYIGHLRDHKIGYTFLEATIIDRNFVVTVASAVFIYLTYKFTSWN